MQKRNILRESAFAVIEKIERIGVIKIGAHFFSIGIFRQEVAGKTLTTKIIEMMKDTDDVGGPIFKRLFTAIIEDAAGDRVIA